MSRSLLRSFHISNRVQHLASLIYMAALAGLAACGGGSSAVQAPPPPPVTRANTYFGMHIHSLAPGTPWPDAVVPSVQFGGLRLWDSGVGWSQINTAASVYDFTHMDSWLSEAKTNNVDVLYDLGRTPMWASSMPNDSTCNYSTLGGGNGQCWPPSDLNPDGSGTDAIWISWVTAVASRYKGQIKYYEIWNEWNIQASWSGTTSQLVRMTQDARCVVEGPPAGSSCNPNSTFPNGTALDPSAQIVTPAPVGGGTSQSALAAAAKNLNIFLTSQAGNVGPGDFVDVIGFHCYVSTQTVGDFPLPENVTTVNDSVAAVPGVQGKPLFCTEGGWGNAAIEGFTDPDLQAAFLARYYLLQTSTTVARVYFYAWDTTPTDIALWSPTDTTPAAIAYGEVYKWINGATPSSACSSNGTVYTCGYTRGSYQALAVWDSNSNSTCYQAGTPTCSTFAIPSQYKLYRDLSGNEISVPGSAIPLSAKPILLETAALP